MRIAHFTNTYKPNVNGVARSVSTFRDALTDLGHLVFVFAQQPHNPYEETEPFVFRFPALKIPGFDYSASVPASRFVDQLIPPLKLDVIHSNHPNLLGSAAADYAEEYDIPLVFTFHTRYVEYSEGYTAYVPFAKAFVEEIIVDALAKYIQRCQHIITPSDSIKRNLEQYAGMSDRLTTIPTGIHVERFEQADGRAVSAQYGLDDYRVLVSISRLAEEKNVKTLLDAAAKVMANHDDVRLLLIGDGPQRSELERHAAQLGIDRRVIFTGLVPFEQVPNHLKAGDLFVYASITETQGLVTVEAMATGLPVVAVDATGTSDVVENRRQGLLTANDSRALAAGVEHVLSDRALYEKMCEAAQETARGLSMEAQARKMVAVYEQAIEDKKAGRNIRLDMEQVKRQLKAR